MCDKVSISEFGVQSNALSMLHEWKQRCAETRTHMMVTTVNGIKWKRPHNGRVKINIDAVVFMKGGSTGIGSVMRNEQGEFMKARN